MPEKKTLERARRDRRQGKSTSTQAGEFVREEIHHIRDGKHGARSTKQAIAIGLSKARRSGVDLPPPRAGRTSESTRQHAVKDRAAGRHPHTPSRRRSQATTNALRHEGRAAASHTALVRQGHASAMSRTATERSAAARRASRTKGPEERSEAARKAARTRARHH